MKSIGLNTAQILLFVLVEIFALGASFRWIYRRHKLVIKAKVNWISSTILGLAIIAMIVFSSRLGNTLFYNIMIISVFLFITTFFISNGLAEDGLQCISKPGVGFVPWEDIGTVVVSQKSDLELNFSRNTKENIRLYFESDNYTEIIKFLKDKSEKYDFKIEIVK